MFTYGTIFQVTRGAMAALILSVAGAVSTAQDVEPAQRAAVPSADAQNQAMALIRDVFKRDYEETDSPAEKAELARKLLQHAEESGDATECFVLLRVARDVATIAGDVETGAVAIDVLEERYRVDATGMTRDMLDKSLRHATTPPQYSKIAEIASAAIDGALFQGKYDEASALAGTAVEAARLLNRTALVERMTARSAEVAQAVAAHQQIQDAVAALERDPANPSANLAVGRQYCFYQGDWEKGLSMLALAGDGQLEVLAKQELVGPTTPEDQVALADGWWELIDGQEGIAQRSIRNRAVHWYRQAVSDLAGLTALRVKKRLEDVAAAESEDLQWDEGEPAAGGGSKATAARRKRSFEGTWQDRFGNVIKFRVDANRKIVGTYENIHRSGGYESVAYRGRIVGKFSFDGRTLNGQWARSPSYKPPEAGPLVLKLARDGNSFTGQYRSGNSGVWSVWTGVRLQPGEDEADVGGEL